MCTAVFYKPGDPYFGRNLDLERSYGESVTVTPRNYPIAFRNGAVLTTHYSMIGMAAVVDNYPLYFEATNEKGLSLAGLNFPGNACYYPQKTGMDNIAPFELIPWILGTCADLDQAREKLQRLNLWDVPFSPALPLSPLHWMLSDENDSLTIEATAEGMRIYENAPGVLTNNPPFPYHLSHLANYMALTPEQPKNNQPISLEPYCLGLGSFGLPGDPSSASRFVRAAITKFHSLCDGSEEQSVNQFFHILGSVCQQRGISRLPDGASEMTLYSCCCNMRTGDYYYTTYDNSRITCVKMRSADLDGCKPIAYPLVKSAQYLYQN